VVWGLRGVDNAMRVLEMVECRSVRVAIREGLSTLAEPEKEFRLARVSQVGFYMNDESRMSKLKFERGLV